MNIEFNDLRMKEVVNVIDGKRLGRICNMIIDCETGLIRGIIVPAERSFSFFHANQDLYIPWGNIKKIGEDLILVEVVVKDECCKPKRNCTVEGKKE